jgi:hypothetical protein
MDEDEVERIWEQILERHASAEKEARLSPQEELAVEEYMEIWDAGEDPGPIPPRSRTGG